MHAQAVDRHVRRGRVEVFILDEGQLAAVHGIGEVRAEAGHVEQIRAAADFLVGRKADADLAVRNRLVGQQPLAQGQDHRHAGLVVRAEQRPAVGHDQILAGRVPEQREHGGGEYAALGQHYVAAVVLFDDAGVHGQRGSLVHRVHVRDQADGALTLAVGGKCAVDIAVRVDVRVGYAHRLHFLDQVPAKDQLALAAGAVLVVFV